MEPVDDYKERNTLFQIADEKLYEQYKILQKFSSYLPQ